MAKDGIVVRGSGEEDGKSWGAKARKVATRGPRKKKKSRDPWVVPSRQRVRVGLEDTAFVMIEGLVVEVR